MEYRSYEKLLTSCLTLSSEDYRYIKLNELDSFLQNNALVVSCLKLKDDKKKFDIFFKNNVFLNFFSIMVLAEIDLRSKSSTKQTKKLFFKEFFNDYSENLSLSIQEIIYVISAGSLCNYLEVKFDDDHEHTEQINEIKTQENINEDLIKKAFVINRLLEIRDCDDNDLINVKFGLLVDFPRDKFLNYCTVINNNNLTVLQNKIKELETSIDDLNLKYDSAEENILNKILKNSLEVVGILLAIFSIIGLNVVSVANFQLPGVLLANLSLALAIVVLFVVIQIIKDECKYKFQILICIIILLTILIIGVASYFKQLPSITNLDLHNLSIIKMF